MTDMTSATSTKGVLDTSHEWLRSRRWILLSMTAAILAFTGSIVALADTRIYDHLTASFLPQALAQDIANLAVAPLLVASATLALRGSIRAYLFWLGVVAFTVYNYVIYAFSVPFGPLFPLWVAVLGLSLFALIGSLQAVAAAKIVLRFTSHRMVTASAWFLLAAAGLFALLWLSDDIPALLTGSTPQSVVDMALPTNPVHILDYAFFLPATVITAIGLLRRNHFSAVTGPAFFVFLVLTCVPILITPLVQNTVSGSIGMMAAIGLIAASLTTVLVLLLRSVRTRKPSISVAAGRDIGETSTMSNSPV